MSGPVLPHISCSSLDKFRRCEWAWADHYIHGNRGPTTTALAFGTALDETHNEALGQVIAGHPLPTEDDCEEIFADLWAHPKRDEFIAWDKPSDPTYYGEIGRSMARAFRREIYPSLRPVAMQEKIHVEFVDAGFSFLGFIDMREEPATEGAGYRLRDFKTAGRSWIVNGPGPGKEAYQLQPVAYITMAEHHLGVPIARDFDFLIGVKTKTPYTQRVSRHVSHDETQGFYRILKSAWARMSALMDGTAEPIPAHQDAWFCSRKFCNAADRCQAKFGVPIKA